jgi:hypothetical protein
MNTPLVSKSTLLPNLTSLRDLLNLLASLRELSNPFSSADDLRTSIELLLNVGLTLGLDSKWLAWLQSIHDNPQLLSLVVAIGQYLENLIEPAQPTQTTTSTQLHSAEAGAAAAIQWKNLLPLITEIAQLLEHLWPIL